MLTPKSLERNLGSLKCMGMHSLLQKLMSGISGIPAAWYILKIKHQVSNYESLFQSFILQLTSLSIHQMCPLIKQCKSTQQVIGSACLQSRKYTMTHDVSFQKMMLHTLNAPARSATKEWSVRYVDQLTLGLDQRFLSAHILASFSWGTNNYGSHQKTLTSNMLVLTDSGISTQELACVWNLEYSQKSQIGSPQISLGWPESWCTTQNWGIRYNSSLFLISICYVTGLNSCVIMIESLQATCWRFSVRS